MQVIAISNSMPSTKTRSSVTIRHFFDRTGAGFQRYCCSINKRWKLNEKGAEVQLRGEGLNAFNHVLFAAPTTDQFNTAFGQINGSTNYPRQIQAVLRISF